MENKVLNKVVVSKCPLDVCRPHLVLSQTLLTRYLSHVSLGHFQRRIYSEKGLRLNNQEEGIYIYIYISRPTAYKMRERKPQSYCESNNHV